MFVSFSPFITTTAPGVPEEEGDIKDDESAGDAAGVLLDGDGDGAGLVCVPPPPAVALAPLNLAVFFFG